MRGRKKGRDRQVRERKGGGGCTWSISFKGVFVFELFDVDDNLKLMTADIQLQYGLKIFMIIY